MSLVGVIALLQAALALLTLVSAHPELGQAARDNAMQVASQAITAATQALAQSQTSNSSQSTNSTPISSLINIQTCPHVTIPSCSTYPIASYDSNHCVASYTCAPAQTTTNVQPQTTGASCTAFYPPQTYADGSVLGCGGTGTGSTDLHLYLKGCTPTACHNGQWVTQ